VLYSFTGGADGGVPQGSPVRDEAGNLYCVTALDGAPGFGVVFKVDPAGTETVLYSFTGRADGAFPETGLVRDKVGNLYDTTVGAGDLSYSCGVVFKINPDHLVGRERDDSDRQPI